LVLHDFFFVNILIVLMEEVLFLLILRFSILIVIPHCILMQCGSLRLGRLNQGSSLLFGRVTMRVKVSYLVDLYLSVHWRILVLCGEQLTETADGMQMNNVFSANTWTSAAASLRDLNLLILTQISGNSEIYLLLTLLHIALHLWAWWEHLKFDLSPRVLSHLLTLFAFSLVLMLLLCFLRMLLVPFLILLLLLLPLLLLMIWLLVSTSTWFIFDRWYDLLEYACCNVAG
jgi:hypothetical protein